MRPVDRSDLRTLGTGALLFAAYVIVGKLGLRLAFAFPSATPVWPATGLALAAFLLAGDRVWPAIFAGAFVVNLTTAGTIATSLGIATGNTLEGLVGAWLLVRFAGGRECLASAESVFKFTLLAGLLSTMVSATVGLASLHVAGLLAPGDVHDAWITWWLGDAAGTLLVAPVLISWGVASPPFDRTRAAETALLFAGLFFTGSALFGGLPGLLPAGSHPTFFCVPFLTWAAVRLGTREAATATLLLAAIAIRGTLGGHGSFAQGDQNASLVMLQAYMGVAAVMTLMLSAAVGQRRSAEEQLRALSISDPLTGIANYRYLITRLEAEVERSERTGRPFAILFMDVDGLKTINDRHGHITGSRALCRVAAVLRDSARVVDLAARYGGDEFALLLPETDEAEAAQVARRLSERLAAGTERPEVRVSIGIALHPRDGATPDALIGAADRQLYRLRSKTRGEPLAAPFAPPQTS